MNKRQYEILIVLLEEEKHFSVEELAERLSCSEKTIRNDFKIIDEWLKGQSSIELIRKPSVGVYLEGPRKEKEGLLKKAKLEKGAGISDNLRKLNIVKMLLLKNDVLTLQELSNQFYISKTVIRSDLEEIEKWLGKYGLQLVKKQKYGIKVVGNERERRIALSQIIRLLVNESKTERKLIESLFTPSEINIVKNELKKMEQELDYSFTDEALENLVTHLLISVKRVKLGSKIEISQEEMEKVQKKKEFQAMERLTKELEKIFAVKLPNQELAYMTLRLLGTKIYYDFTLNNKQIDEELSRFDASVITFAKKLIISVSDVSGENFLNDKHLLLGLSFHLQTTFHRLKHSFPVSNPMLQEIKKMYFGIFEIIYYVMPSLEEEFQVKIPEDEIAYIALHFQASLERIKKRNAEYKKVLIVCSMGVGMSQLLRTKLERKFHSLNIVGTTSVKEAKKEIREKKPDFIISTVPFHSEEVPAITVSPLLMLEEERKIDEFIKSNGYNQTSFPAIRRLLDKELIFVNLSCEKPDEIIEVLTDAMEKKGYIQPEYKESILSREKQSSTAIGGGISIPHGNPDYVHEAKISIAVFHDPVKWGDNLISIVFLLAMNHKEKGMLKELFKDISRLVDDEMSLMNLKSKMYPKDIFDFF